MTTQANPVTIPNSEQFILTSKQGLQYLIQLSWPLHWQDTDTTEREPVPVIYIVDGNALFLTATETAWRRKYSVHHSTGGVVVAIGYPDLKGQLFDKRRTLDLTPPSPTSGPGFGGAKECTEFLEGPVKAAIRERLPKVKVAREALYGHSFGGLFALYALFTRPGSFDCFIASSPSIWLHDKSILAFAREFLHRPDSTSQAAEPSHPPTILLSWGSHEQDPPRRPREDAERYAARKKMDNDFRIPGNCSDLFGMLRDCARVKVWTPVVFEGEEHTSVMGASLGKGLTWFFEEWPLRGTDQDERSREHL